MKTFDSIKQEVLAWSVIAIAFGALTFVAINLDNIRESSVLNPTTGSTSTQQENIDFHPGYSVVLAQ
jgi:hypothetical protein